MKNLIIAFIMMISISSFAQEGCTASITKLTGDAFLKKVEIKRMHKIDLNKDCKYKVLSFSVEFTTTKKEYHQYDLPGDEVFSDDLPVIGIWNHVSLTTCKIHISAVWCGRKTIILNASLVFIVGCSIHRT